MRWDAFMGYDDLVAPIDMQWWTALPLWSTY